MIVDGRRRAASTATRPAARIIEALWATSTAPSHTGLTLEDVDDQRQEQHVDRAQAQHRDREGDQGRQEHP